MNEPPVENSQVSPTEGTPNDRQTIIEIGPDNVGMLIDLRKKIDGRTVDEIREEAKKYGARQDGMMAFVVMSGLSPVGYVEMEFKRDSPKGVKTSLPFNNLAHLSRIGVVTESQGKGIGRSLMNATESWARSHGRTGIWLDYREDNYPAAGFYDRCGYRRVGSFIDRKRINRAIVAKVFESAAGTK